MEVCACLGLLTDGQAERLHEAGTTAYNHNLNTAEARYTDICSTHSYQDRAIRSQSEGRAACRRARVSSPGWGRATSS